MRKSMKKIIALVSSAAIAATMVTVPVMTEAAETDSVVVEEGTFTLDDDGVATATVNNNGDTPAIVAIISASYDQSGKLVDVKYVPETIQPGAKETIKTAELTDKGDKIEAFVWDMTNNQCKPVYIAEDETPPTWDIGLFTLTADKKYVDVKEGGEVKITVSDILDSGGYPVDYVPETAIKWSCTEDTLTVERGKLIIPAGFDIGDAETKDITVNCTIGDVTNGVTIVVHSYDVFETFDDITDSWGFTGEGGIRVENGALIFFPDSNDNGDELIDTKIFGNTITKAKKLHVMFDWHPLLVKGTVGESIIELTDSSGIYICAIRQIGYKIGNSDLYASELYYSTDGRDGSRFKRNFPNDWCSVDLVIDFTVDPPKLDSEILGPEMAVGSEAPINKATNFGQLRVRNISGLAPMEIDNFRIKVLK